MKDLWKSIRKENPPEGVYVLVWNSNSKFPVIAKFAKSVWRCSGGAMLSTLHGKHWMRYVAPDDYEEKETNLADTRKCGKCNRDLPLDRFTKDSKRVDGLSWRCKDCARDYMKSVKARNTPSQRADWAERTLRGLAWETEQ